MTESTLQGVKDTVARVLGLGERANTLDADTPLFGAMPELDSLAVVELAAALEEHFDLQIDDDDFTGDTFETIGSLSDFIDDKRG